jgi:serine/threonine protein kinase
MDASRAKHIHALFTQAVDMTIEERKAFLDKACSGAAEIRAGVESLLAALERAGEFLSDPTFAQDPAATPVFPGIGSRIGPYILRRVIGEGGSGLVFLAGQEQPLRREVALKVIKAGMDTHEVIARFEAERQALAVMDHPNIAKVFDAGTSQDGRPYFVMELVGGRPITEFCRKHRLPVRARVNIFIAVCKAVQHANAKGIIHRDLKPSNVLVAVHDRRPVPKVIDFGIAKALDVPLTGNTVVTTAWQFMGTPQYMSPEQIMMAADVDRRSDVYSLGATLYEILTDVAPIDSKELQGRPFSEVQRIICERDPLPPSARVAMPTKTISAEVTAENSERSQRAPELRGDLDWVTLKALHKDRAHRYQDAEALADDLERYLDNKPVEAAPPDRLYRLSRFSRRHRSGLAAVLAVSLVLGAVLWLMAAKIIPHPLASSGVTDPLVVAAPHKPALVASSQRAATRADEAREVAQVRSSAVVSSTAPAEPLPTLLRDALVYFTFDRKDSYQDGQHLVLRDLSSRHNDAVVTGAKFVPGVFGEALHLGVDDRINTRENIGIKGNAPRTVAFFLSFSSVPHGRWHSILGWGAGTQNKNFWAKTFHSHYQLWASGTGNDWTLPGDADELAWHHHAITFDGTSAHWYIDGVSVPPGFVHRYETIDTPVEIGGEDFKIDDLVIFPRALTLDEIKVLYSGIQTSGHVKK